MTGRGLQEEVTANGLQEEVTANGLQEEVTGRGLQEEDEYQCLIRHKLYTFNFFRHPLLKLSCILRSFWLIAYILFS